MILTVTSTSDSGPGSLRDTIAQAQSQDIINFNLPSDSTITLTSGQIDIPLGKDLIIDGGNVTNLTISGNNNSRIFNLNSSAAQPNALTIKNLTLTRGLADQGGALNIIGDMSNVTVDQVNFNDNVATRSGGAIFTNFRTNLTVLNSKFNRNISTAANDERGAGAIAFWGPNNLTIKNSEFTENKGINGGAVNNLNGKLLIDNCKFIRNDTTSAVYDPGKPNPFLRGFGGALYTDRASSVGEPSGYIRIYNSLFQENQGRGEGGAAYLYTGTQDQVLIDSSTFENNQIKPLPNGGSPGRGGAIAQVNNGPNQGFIVRNSTFANNTANEQGGALWKNWAPTTVVNSTFFGNRAENLDNPTSPSVIGGAMLFTGPGNIINTTIANNYAGWVAGGIATDNKNLSVKNTIFANNFAANGGNNWKTNYNTNLQISSGQNNIQFPDRNAANDNYAVAGIMVVDPKLGPLQDNGGSTKTMMPLPGSGAIDAGTDVDAPIVDQIGESRQIDGDGNGTAIRDIGAVEANASNGLTPELDVSSDANNIIDGNLTGIDFGTTTLGNPISKTFTIVNSGTDVLALNELFLPNGFVQIGSFPSSLNPGQQADITIQMNATSAANPNGDVYLSSNDSNESPFSFAIQGKVVGLINGTAANDTLNGSAADEVINALDGNDNVNGNPGNETIDGGAGNDTLNPGAGTHLLMGGTGNDTYILNNSSSVITETSTLPTEIDSINSLVSYSLGANLENLSLQGTASINGTGNTLNNFLVGNNGSNILITDMGNDTILGNGGDDSLDGGTGNDNLNGGTGNDTQNGGTGNDTYTVDSASDLVIETSNINTEIDTVNSLVPYSLGSNLENLTLSGSDSINGTGNELNNIINGNSANNVLIGAQGNDNLNGGAGSDTLNGGQGNDSYNVDNINDVIIETSTLATEIDMISSSVDYSLGPNLENLFLTGTATNGTGNELNNLISGNASNNVLVGGAGNDNLSDNLGNDYLIAGLGNDNLSGGAGDDTLDGGQGNDSYTLDSVNDVVIETSTLSTERDTVTIPLSYTLGANVENLNLSGTANINGSGNVLANGLTGNAGDNTLRGDQGNDNLNGAAGNDFLCGDQGNDFNTGGLGLDTFAFNSPTDGVDSISDFNVSDDKIALSIWGFGVGAISPGPLNASQLAIGSVATNPQPQFIYNSSTGNLFFDRDGTGSNTPVQFATLTTRPSITSSNLIVYNDDSANTITYSIAANSANLAEGASSTLTPISFLINRTGLTGVNSSIRYNLSGDAINGGDYQVVGVSGDGVSNSGNTVNFAPGASVATLTLNVVGDSTYELDESLNVSLSNPNTAKTLITQTTATTTITNDDPLPGIRANPVYLTEGNTGTTNANFFVTLTNPSSQIVTVVATTSDGTATAGSDYQAVSRIVTFTPGQIANSFVVPVSGDTDFEQNETFLVNFSNPTNSTIANPSATGFINNDDPVPPIDYSIVGNTPSIVEGANASNNLVSFLINRSNFTGTNSSVRYSFTGDAIQWSDFQVASVTGDGITTAGNAVNFATGASVATLTLRVMGDSTFELDETLNVNLSNPSPTTATISTPSASTVILNDDVLPTVRMNAATVVEGNSGTTNANFVVFLSNSSYQNTTVDFTTTDGSASFNSDYTATSGTLTFTPGQNVRTITVPVSGDVNYEPNETFTVNLSNVNGGTIGNSSVVGNITNDDLTLTGTDNADVLVAGSENNTLVGGGGADTLTGGAGNDLFLYNNLTDQGDLITDFRLGQDKISLSFLSSLGYAGTDPIADGYVQFLGQGPDSAILIDSDGSLGTNTAVNFILVRNISVANLNNPANFVF